MANQRKEEFAAEVAAIMERIRAKQAAVQPATPTPTTSQVQAIAPNLLLVADPREAVKLLGPTASEKEAAKPDFVWNERQQEAINLALSGASFCLIGAAGTGKTTTTKEIVRQLILQTKRPPMTQSTKVFAAGKPGIAGTSFTRRAVRNLRKAMPTELQEHCATLHAILEYEPVFYEVFDPASQEWKKTMRFEPTRGANNPLPTSLLTIIVDESSMVSVELYEELCAALAHAVTVQFIFLGDLNQLPPVYGRAILGFKLNELRVVELTEVYRQALESPIIRLAHRILQGFPMLNEETMSETWSADPKLKLHPWRKQLDADQAFAGAAAFMRQQIDQGLFDPEDSVVLCPYNKSFGTIELNRVIAQKLGEMRGATVHEVIAGFEKHYLAVGDRVLIDKEDAEVVKISHNARYVGKRPQPASPKLDRWGALQLTKEELAELRKAEAKQKKGSITDIDLLLHNLTSEDVQDRKQSASHVVTFRMLDTNREVVLDAAGEFNDLIFSYALTVHKSQGSEWRKVYCIFHHSHAAMVSRELLYTAVTRAREELYVIFEPQRAGKGGTFGKGIATARLKGLTWQQKADFFKGLSEKELKSGLLSQ